MRLPRSITFSPPLLAEASSDHVLATFFSWLLFSSIFSIGSRLPPISTPRSSSVPGVLPCCPRTYKGFFARSRIFFLKCRRSPFGFVTEVLLLSLQELFSPFLFCLPGELFFPSLASALLVLIGSMGLFCDMRSTIATGVYLGHDRFSGHGGIFYAGGCSSTPKGVARPIFEDDISACWSFLWHEVVTYPPFPTPPFIRPPMSLGNNHPRGVFFPLRLDGFFCLGIRRA